MVMMNNKIVITFLSIFAIVAFIFASYKLTNVAQPVNYPAVNVLSSTDHLQWSPAKKNILVE